MAFVNRVTILGNVCRKPDARAFPDGKPLTELTVATNEKWHNKATGERGEIPEYHRVICAGPSAAFAADQIDTGDRVYVEGRLKTRKWTDPQGIERYGTEIRVDMISRIGGN